MRKIIFICIFIPFILITYGFPTFLFSQSQDISDADLKKDEVCISGNCENGKGTFKYNNGDVYIGLWKDGKHHGKGVSIIIISRQKYIGEFKDDMYNGQGTKTWTNEFGAEKKYIGQFKDGKFHGQGTFTSEGTMLFVKITYKYIGQWENDLRHGRGTSTDSDGEMYIGQWENGQRHGNGTMKYSDGKKESGKWYEDQFIGE